MRRVSQVCMLFLVVAVALLWVVAPVNAAKKGAADGQAPTPDGRFSLTTTSIAENTGVSWADGRFSFKNQDYKFRVEAQTSNPMGASELQGLAGQQITYSGELYNLKNVSDFAGTYTRIKPEAVKAMGGTGKRPAFHNEKGVVLVITNRYSPQLDVSLRLIGDSFKVMLRDL